MNAPRITPARRLGAEALAAVALCAGAYYFLVDPVAADLAGAREQVAARLARRTLNSGAVNLTDAQVTELHRLTREHADDIARRSDVARSEAVLYERVSSLADARSVRLDALTPAAIAGSRAAPAAPAPPPPPPPPTYGAGPAEPPPPPPPKDTRAAYTITAQGTYADLVAFAGDLANRLGFTIVRAVRISRSDSPDPELLRATILTEHLTFDLSAVALPDLTGETPTPPAPARAAAPQE